MFITELCALLANEHFFGHPVQLELGKGYKVIFCLVEGGWSANEGHFILPFKSFFGSKLLKIYFRHV